MAGPTPNIFDEQGIEEPTTWDELDAAATKLKDAGITPYYQTSILFTFQWFQQLVAGTDPELYKGLSTGDVKYTDPEIVDIMNIWLEEQENGTGNLLLLDRHDVIHPLLQ